MPRNACLSRPPDPTPELIPQALRAGAALAGLQNGAINLGCSSLSCLASRSSSCPVHLPGGSGSARLIRTSRRSQTPTAFVRPRNGSSVATRRRRRSHHHGPAASRCRPRRSNRAAGQAALGHRVSWGARSIIRVNRSRIPPPSAIVTRAGVLHMLIHAEPGETSEPGRGVDRRFQWWRTEPHAVL